MPQADELTQFYEELGRRLRDARLDADLSQAKLAKLLGLTRSSIANIEAGRQRIQAHTVVSIAAELSMPIEKILPSRDALSANEAHVALHDSQFESDSARKFVRDSLANLVARKTGS